MKNLTSIAEHSDYLSASTYSNSERWELHRLRIKFGKQPLELWMFVPCKLVDSVWVVLEEPILNPICCNKPNDDGRGFPECCGSPDPDYDTEEWTGYFKAKERCLFEGFEIEYSSTFTKIVEDENNILSFTEKLGRIKLNGVDVKTVEDIAKCNSELTPTAQKQIGYE